MKTNKKVVLKYRDLEIFRFLLRYKVTKFRIIKEQFFPSTSNQCARQRLLKLVHAGYLVDHWFDFNGLAEKVYFLNKKVDWKFVLQESFQIEAHNSSSIEHDLTLSTIGIRISKFDDIQSLVSESEIKGIEKYKSERVYLPFKLLNSDLVARVKISGETYNFAIEYERRIKPEVKYKEKMELYYSQDTVDAVLYICEDVSIKNTLQKFDKRFKSNHSSKIFFTTLKKFNEEEPVVSFVSSDSRAIDLKISK